MRPDIENAAREVKLRFGYGRELKTLPDVLTQGEEVEKLIIGKHGKQRGLLVLTPQRFLFYFSVATVLPTSTTIAIPLDQITAVSTTQSGLFATLRITSASTVAEFTEVPRQYVDAFARSIQSTPTAATPPAETSTSAADQLLKLKQLHDAGILSADEYETKRAPLIAQL